MAVVRQGPDGVKHDLLPMPWNARTRVHEYGGKSYLPLPDGFVFANFGDQRLYRWGTSAPVALAPVAPTPVALTPAPVRGRRRPVRRLCPAPGGARCGASGSGTVLAGRSPARSWRSRWTARERAIPPRSGSWSAVRISTPTRRRHRMAPGWPGSAGITPRCRGTAPNCGSRRSTAAGRSATQHQQQLTHGLRHRVGLGPGLAGRPQPVRDIRPFGLVESLRRLTCWPSSRALCPREEEFASPLWQLGLSPHAVLGDGRLAVAYGTGETRLGVLDPDSGRLTDLDLPYQVFVSGVSAAKPDDRHHRGRAGRADDRDRRGGLRSRRERTGPRAEPQRRLAAGSGLPAGAAGGPADRSRRVRSCTRSSTR